MIHELAPAPVVPADALHAGFAVSAVRWPDRPALLLGEARWTYAELDGVARRIAAGLLELVAMPARVGILARRSLTSYAGVLGSLLAGAAYVPLNPSLPAARLRAIADAAELDAIVCERAHLGLLPALLAGRTAPPAVIVTDARRAEIPDLEPAGLLDRADLAARAPYGAAVPTAPDAPAYLLFTSGSTGAPKGVPVAHANAAAFLRVNLARYAIGPDDVLSQTFEQSFDLSVFDMFAAWSSGAALCGFTPAELLAPLEVVRARGITIWFSVPSLVAMQRRLRLLTPDSLPSLRLSLFCGEPLAREHVEDWQAAAPASVIENLYGPTELTIACSAHRWDPASSPALCANGIVPIGQLYAPLSGRIVDAELRPVARGEDGELCVAGPQTVAGYWRNPAANAAAFCELAGDDGAPERYYRTGDIVRELPGGEMVFVGRRDSQVKLGGHRIELGEIEAALRAQPGVAEAAAFAWPRGAATVERIVAAVAGEGLEASALRDGLRSVLPAYMLPASVHVVGAMPRTSSGKLDRRALGDELATTTVAVIGGGFSGLCVAANLHRAANGPARVLVFERAVVGNGVAYGTREPVHLLNGPAGNLSAFDDQPDHFVDFLAGDAAAQPFIDPDAPLRGQYVPRLLYARYLARIAAELERPSAAGATVTFVAAGVSDVIARPDGVEIRTEDGATRRADAAVLAIGHPAPRSLAERIPPACLVDDPWDAAAVRAIPPGVPVTVVGSGQTATDLVLGLVANGHQGRITLLSRRGRLAQPVRPAGKAYTADGDRLPRRLGPLVRWVRAEAARFEAEGGDWRAVVNALRPHTQALWQGFTLGEKRRFLEHVGPFWYTHRTRLPPRAVERFGALLESGRVELVAGRIVAAEAGAEGVVLRVRPRGADTTVALPAGAVINCTGPWWDVRAPGNPLVATLLRAGRIRWDELGHGFAVAPDGALIDAAGRTAERLFSVGPPCRGTLLEITAVRDIRTQCAALAAQLLGVLKR